MALPQPVVVNEDYSVRQELRALGLTPEMVIEVARSAASAKAEALEIDPAGAPGTKAYHAGVRATRMALLPLGWRMSRPDNVEATVNDELGIQLVFQNVDIACTERVPQALSIKGAGSRKLIQDGQVELFDRNDPKAPDAVGSKPTVWVICVSSDAKKLRAEVSCPEAFEGNQYDGFTKRIFVLDENLEPTPFDDVHPDEGDGPSEHEVVVLRK